MQNDLYFGMLLSIYSGCILIDLSQVRHIELEFPIFH